MIFEAHYPIHPLLRKYIRYYYFVRVQQPDHLSNYLSFPNTTIPVNIHKNVDCRIAGDRATVSATPETKVVTISNGLRETPLYVTWNGSIDKVTIAFTAVGINHFISKNLPEAVSGHANVFTAWDGNDYTACLDKFYAVTDNRQRVKLLEDFLLGVYHPFDKSALLQQVIDRLCDFSQEMPVPEIARMVNISERSLNRLFHLHIGLSPVAYRKIARFRQSLEGKVVHDKFKRLTDIGYDSHYYDQPYFIRMCNKLSGKSPKALFKSVDKLADNNVIFEFIG
ncbi:helix-turn-helix domain-containing protein [Chitinophaga horti]|uniref:Helix-turn-helix domain-containing protein n=1 Tax=Chitinophaga horti TaxID=2920382 RepID=A0ABY6J186_9BACT|nr:helix-turn-helix domain-containing protein [Chitinophaga horti]UYQ93410.1 helix-turn-helix domain-containing protein [Chitinophaga horti]